MKVEFENIDKRNTEIKKEWEVRVGEKRQELGIQGIEECGKLEVRITE
jgi:hypothetical protein